MQAIVSTLDDPYREMALDVWGGLKAVTGLKQLTGAAAPRFSYQLAERYDAAADAALRGVAAETRPFTVATGAAAVLRGPRCLVYLPLLANDDLDRLHRALWMRAGRLAEGLLDAHAPGSWAPHITLAAGRIDESRMPAVLRFLEGRDTRWELPITNIGLVADTSAPDPALTLRLGAS
ncbi:MAG: 2'-5' RNA ligase family protein [Dehalococcoidia bacterium]|nr:MAG: 2'-5' RNA ligase family protein [Dehalococcoidia bacterium]